MLKIGWASKDISTNEPVLIPGQSYLRISRGVMDPVMVNALTLENDGEYVIFLQADCVNFNAGVLKALRKLVSEKNAKIDPDKIVMNCTHTHAGPLIGYNDYQAVKDLDKFDHSSFKITLPEEYLPFFLDRASSAIIESFEGRKEGSVSFGQGYAVAAHSRRTVYNHDMTEGSDNIGQKLSEGTARMYGDTNKPEFSGFESGADHYSNFVFTFDKDGKLTGIVINIPCPSQNMELEYYLSSDYWHNVRTEVKKQFGEDVFVLPQCAAAGDLAPRVLYNNAAQERRFRLKFSDMKFPEDMIKPSEIYDRQDIALQIMQSLNEVYEWAKKEKYSDVPIKHSVKILPLPKRLITEEEYNFCKMKMDTVKFTEQVTDDKVDDFKRNTSMLSYYSDYVTIVERYEADKKCKTFDSEIHVIRVGDMAFTTNQFELYMDFAHQIQARSPFVQTFVVQLCAQPEIRSGSYLATEKGAKNRGYSANFYANKVSPEGGTMLVEETLKLLNEMAD